MSTRTEEEKLPSRLRALRVKLKSGEYDGADLMAAWCAMAQAADEIERLDIQLTAELKWRRDNCDE